MDEARLSTALTGLLDAKLASDLVGDLLKLRRDCATHTLERASSGKFVETFVQCLQYIDTGTYEAKPNVDDYLGKRVENTSIPEGLRVCAARVARAIYAFRNKRNIVHKNDVDTNIHDLIFTHEGAAWIVAELLRHAKGISMQEAGALVELVQIRVGTLVEEICGTRLIHADVSVKVELLILLHSHYPDPVTVDDVLKSLSRRGQGTVRNRLRELHTEKLAHGDGKTGYRLTQAGHVAAVEIIKALSL